MTELRVHTYTAAEPGIFVNSYVLETMDGVVLVDTGLLVSDARAPAARLAALRKPLLAAFVTHPHPDHFNRLPYLVGDDVPVYATALVATTIEQTAVAKRESHADSYLLVEAAEKRHAFIGDLAFDAAELAGRSSINAREGS